MLRKLRNMTMDEHAIVFDVRTKMGKKICKNFYYGLIHKRRLQLILLKPNKNYMEHIGYCTISFYTIKSLATVANTEIALALLKNNYPEYVVTAC